jgi:hypothetical protein
MSYNCDICDYTTNDSGNYSRHKKTKKHLQKSTIIYEEKNKVSTNSSKISKVLVTKLSEKCNSFKCNKCGSDFNHNSSLSRHKKKCMNKLKLKLEIEQREKSELLNNFMVNYNTINKILDDTKNIAESIKYIDNSDCNILDKNLEINIIETIKENNLTIDQSQTLILNNVIIISRIIDNYINATQLCKAGNRKFNHWISLDSTKDIITELESETGIPASQLVEIKKGNSSNFEQGSWIHPDLAIQLAQWISAKFALQVSKWVRSLFSNSKVEITIKALKNKENELIIKNEKIKLLENLHVKKQKRQEYPDQNVIYILSTEDNKKKRIYIIGKAKNLKHRLSTYNKTSEHQVIYYKSCNTEDNMNIIETIVLTKLSKYREKANRDRFILPLNQNISLFTNIIEQSIKFFQS